ncbi:MAG: bifunctional demethylmenaquinone methyltransferase/2-methoxy-6-polyprenyl-1,4-benzoquinol methylase UbiE [Thermodesulfobacteriota bacterium]
MGIPSKYPSIKDLSDEQRVRLVRRIFNSVTDRYDFLNHFLSAGRDKVWRRFLIERLHFFTTDHLLDLATGTGDIAIGAVAFHSQIRVVGLDFSWSMLKAASVKKKSAGIAERLSLIQGDALHLPFPAATFDAVTIGFGIRNMPDREKVIKEIVRILAPGGKIHILELTAPQSRWFRRLYLIYLNHLLPRLARWFTKDPAAYLYLAESILHFPSPGELAAEMEAYGLTEVAVFPLTAGITCLHEGKKPAAQNTSS